MKITLDFSSNYSKKKRLKRDIKFVIIHYTGMQSEIESLKRLKDPKYKVSCHYIISRKGKVTQMVREEDIAWHAGKSRWKKFKNLNNYSIGIELINKGHQFGYQNFSHQQISSLVKLCKKIKKKYFIKKENFLGHSDIAPLRKTDPGEKFPWKKLSKYNIGKWYVKTNSKIEVYPKKIETLFFKNLKKFGFRYFRVNKKNLKNKMIIKAFQRHYLPNCITGKIDKKTYEISHFLTN
ncbi:N-acetylmuramoyl-L-alanine amidase [Candidatus Pelagibacter bacterium]|nr:N-acetylmuramoyl-L-alanine amidase [Candidatus Pelagibacter bacterium]MDA9619048.1 N-acetylmuramoyl-L-alanine amidase [Candidatus Pelagibacter bacterium]